jgi:hypothetical protein
MRTFSKTVMSDIRGCGELLLLDFHNVILDGWGAQQALHKVCPLQLVNHTQVFERLKNKESTTDACRGAISPAYLTPAAAETQNICSAMHMSDLGMQIPL